MLDLNDKSVLITGGSRGLGRALALSISARGARVVLVAREKTKLDRAVSDIRSQGGTAFGIVADVGEKALAQVKRGAVELLTPRFDQASAEALAAKLAGGHWTHDYALTATEAKELGLPVKVGMPLGVMALMKLYPQPVQQSGVEFLPIDMPTKRRM